MDNSIPLPRGQACARCRRQKTKCDGDKPRCGPCLRAKQECHYGPPLPRAQKLEDRLKELEIQVLAMSSSKSTATSTATNAILPTDNDAENDFKRGAQEILSIRVNRPPRMPQVPISSSLESWNHKEDMPISLRNELFETFLRLRPQFGVELYLPTFKASMFLPQSDRNSLHPALIYAILLASISSYGLHDKGPEERFLRLHRDQVQKSLENTDRLEHCLWAWIIVTWYYMRTGRIEEAYHSSGVIVRFVLACELDQISDPIAYLRSSGRILGPPRDKIHVAERINLWWSAYLLDRRISLAMGLPGGLPDFICERSCTVWPRAFEHVEKHGLYDWRRASLLDLFTHQSDAALVSRDTLLSLRAKCMALLYRATWPPQVDHLNLPLDYWTMHFAMSNAIARFQSSLPDLKDSRGLYRASDQLEDINPVLAQVHISIFASAVVLHGRKAQNEPAEYEKCLDAARGMAEVVRSVDDMAFLYTQCCLGPILYHGAEVLLREIRSISPRSTSEQMRRLPGIKEDFGSLLQHLSRQTTFYPGLGEYVARVRVFV